MKWKLSTTLTFCLICFLVSNDCSAQNYGDTSSRDNPRRLFLRNLVQRKMQTGQARTLQNPPAGSGFQTRANVSDSDGLVTTDLKLKSPTRQKTLPVRFTALKQSGKYPVIILSHGAGGSADGNVNLVRAWAKAGFAVIQPTHADSVSLQKSMGRSYSLRDSSEQSKDPENWLDRVADIEDVINCLDQINAVLPDIQLDRSRLGAAGHSFGAFTTQLVAGVTPPRKANCNSLEDKRIKAFIFLSPQGLIQGGPLGFDSREAWNGLRRPAMVMTGGLDRGMAGETPDWRLQPFEFSPPGEKYLAFLNDATHMTFGGSSVTPSPVRSMLSRKMGGSTNESQLYKVIEDVSTLFWLSYLKDDQQALEKLRTTELQPSVGYLKSK